MYVLSRDDAMYMYIDTMLSLAQVNKQESFNEALLSDGERQHFPEIFKNDEPSTETLQSYLELKRAILGLWCVKDKKVQFQVDYELNFFSGKDRARNRCRCSRFERDPASRL